MDSPRIIFDKSFLHRLKAEHLFELNIFFDIIASPILKLEILADLSKPGTPKTDWVSVAKSLCRKMAMSGTELVHYRRAALAELAGGHDIPMNGALLIDISAPHVTIYDSSGIHIDGKLVQSEWRRWADRNFTDEEKQIGQELRSDINNLDMSATHRLRKTMGPLYAHCKTSDAVIQDVRAFTNDPDPAKQALVFSITMSNLGITADDQPVIIRRLNQMRAKTLREGAPYAASITQVYFSWIALQARGFHGQRKSDMCDLEYLFYAPFCKVFASCDRLHKTLWNAATTTAIWCDGFELLDDLATRAELRMKDPDRVKGAYPIPLKGSVITRIFEQLRKRTLGRL